MTFTNYQTGNNAKGTIKVPISSSATSVQLSTGQGSRFPSSFPFLSTLSKHDTVDITKIIKREIVKVTNRVGDVLTIVRSFGTCLPDDDSSTPGTQAFSFDALDDVQLLVTSEQIQDIQAELVAIRGTELPLKLNVADFQAGTQIYGASSTGNDDYAITLSPEITTLTTTMTFRFKADVGNTGPATLNVNGLGAKTIKKLHDQDLVTGDIEAGQIVMVSYDGTNFQMDSQVALIASAIVDQITDSTYQLGEGCSVGDALCLASDNKLYKTVASNLARVNFYGFSQETLSTGAYPKVTIGGINSNQSGLTDNTLYYLSNTAGLIATTPGTYSVLIGRSRGTTKIQLDGFLIGGTDFTAVNLPTERAFTTGYAVYTKYKSITIGRDGRYKPSFDLRTLNAGSATYGKVYKNGVAIGTEGSTTSLAYVTISPDTNLYFQAGDTIEFWGKNPGGNAWGLVTNFKVQYSLFIKPSILASID